MTELRIVLATLLLIGSIVAGAPAAQAAAGGDVLNLDGRGHGHGVGLSQWGAERMAREGRTTREILGTFYPGSSLGLASGDVRVVVHESAGGAMLTFPQGGEVRSAPSGEQAPGFPVRLGPGGAVRLGYDGTHRAEVVEPGHDAGAGAQLGHAAASSHPLWAVPVAAGTVTVTDRGRTYRGAIEAIGAGGGLRLLNRLDVEAYLKGMAEVPGSWPAPAVEAQAIAARTYALRAMLASGEICDTERCQVYVGIEGEHPGQSAAVAATRGQVIAYDGTFAAAVYSADAGGHSATTLEGFGTPDGVYPYLQAIPYRPTGEPDPRAWRVRIGLGDVARRLSYPGQLDQVRVVETGPSGRALTVELAGTAGRRTLEGRHLASALGLRSTLFTVGKGDGAARAPEPPPPSELQSMPGAGAGAAGSGGDIGGLSGLARSLRDHPEPAAAAPLPVPERAASDRLPAPAAVAAAAAVALVGAALAGYPELYRRDRGAPGAGRATLRRWMTGQGPQRARAHRR